MNWELIGAILAFVSLVITLYIITKNNIKEFEKLNQRTLENEKNLNKLKGEFEKDILMLKENFELKMEMIKREREERVKSIYENINELRTSQNLILTEIRALTGQISKLGGILDEHRNGK